MEKRPFGRTGKEFPILGFGGQRIVDEHNCTEDEAIEIVTTTVGEALDACKEGRIRDGKTLATFFLAQLHGFI